MGLLHKRKVMVNMESELVNDLSCICKSCERDIKRNIDKENYQPRWIRKVKDIPECILPDCFDKTTIIHTNMANREQISTLLNITVPSGDEKLPVPLCETHYKKLHRMLNDAMYSHKKCKSCGIGITGPGRHCPDIDVVKHHFSTFSNINLQIAPTDEICNCCYNTHLSIVHDVSQISFDHELLQLVESSKSSIPVEVQGGEGKPHLQSAMHQVIIAVGNVLTKSLAVLFPGVYDFYLREAVEQSDPPVTESQVRDEMPKRYLLSRLIAFFGKHLAYECKQRGCGMLLYRRSSDLGLCLAKSLRSTDVSFLSMISADSKSESTNEEMLESVFMSMNECIRREISKITEADAISPYDISSFSVEKTISNIDPMIWKMVVLLTRTVTERKKNT